MEAKQIMKHDLNRGRSIKILTDGKSSYCTSVYDCTQWFSEFIFLLLSILFLMIENIF
jgi:hypothetical protein